MTSFTFEVQDQGLNDALKEVSAYFSDMSPVMESLSIKLLENTQRRFETGTDPDGKKWAKNTDVTLAFFAAKTAEKSSYRRKNGELNKRGLQVYANKRPLYDGGDLKNRIFSDWGSHEALLSSPMPYSAIHQFGGKTGAGSWIPGVLIPARPFMPIHADGTIFEGERNDIQVALNDYVAEAIRRFNRA